MTNGYVLKEMYRDKLEFPDLQKAMVSQAEKHNPSAIYVEDKASGQSAVQSLRLTTRFPIIPVGVDSDKRARANAVTGLFEAGAVILPGGAPWIADFIDEMTSFDSGAHDDQVDACVGALSQLALKPVWSVVIEDDPVPQQSPYVVYDNTKRSLAFRQFPNLPRKSVDNRHSVFMV